jgi:hypothetical protein
MAVTLAKGSDRLVEARWPRERANAWYAEQPWLVGCNFIPSTAINQLEMWQADTFDPETIDRELGWAARLGFNAVRVYLHDLVWLAGATGFKSRIGHYLDITIRHGIQTMFVLFDDGWHDDPVLGAQPAPRPGVHNSGWVKSPGSKVVKNPAGWGRLEDYVSDIVSTFGSDERVVVWDVYNEPGNDFVLSLGLPVVLRYAKLLYQLARHLFLPSLTSPLLQQAFSWARSTHPIQPLTTATWYLTPSLESKLNQHALALSDVFSFHSYFDLEITSRLVGKLQALGRPLLCTEYLARKAGCLFETHLPLFRREKIGCYNWGLVSGKTQTIYSWEEVIETGAEPPLWFHDILRADGTPYREEEARVIRKLTAES